MPFTFRLGDYTISCSRNHDIDLIFESGLNETCSFYFNHHPVGGKATSMGNFVFTPLPGCYGVVVSSGTFLIREYRNSVHSDAFRRMKDVFATKCGFSAMIATVDKDNGPAVGNLRKSGYNVVDEFYNKRTNHNVAVGIKHLPSKIDPERYV